MTRNGPPSCDEVVRARPRRGGGAPDRVVSHYEAILRLLRERAEQGRGVLGSELYSHPELYGRSPRNRISEARKAGHLIEGKPSGASDWFYRLIRETSGAKPGAASPDWYASFGPRPSAVTPAKHASLPLFDQAARQ